MYSSANVTRKKGLGYRMKKRCHSCKGNRSRHTRYCLRCWIRDTVRRTCKVTDKEAKELLTTQLHQKLLQQNFTCVYTGRRLIPGQNMSLDHILPSSLYPEGLTELDNLVWCDLTVNVAKNNLLPNQFLVMCKDVVYYKQTIL